jgi:hypothetical protein
MTGAGIRVIATSLLKHPRDGSFASEAAVRQLQELNRHLKPQAKP